MNDFNALTDQEKQLFLQYMQVYQILKQNPKAINQIVPSYLQRSL
jgi:hypothetical protein